MKIIKFIEDSYEEANGSNGNDFVFFIGVVGIVFSILLVSIQLVVFNTDAMLLRGTGLSILFVLTPAIWWYFRKKQNKLT